ncbi:hypothetical protein FQN57_001378 [Myotisia sp. PD_48]|nr:hypothetical protein FQN57_001378 [Myotisia sp. PD_48]
MEDLDLPPSYEQLDLPPSYEQASTETRKENRKTRFEKRFSFRQFEIKIEWPLKRRPREFERITSELIRLGSSRLLSYN